MKRATIIADWLLAAMVGCGDGGAEPSDAERASGPEAAGTASDAPPEPPLISAEQPVAITLTQRTTVPIAESGAGVMLGRAERARVSVIACSCRGSRLRSAPRVSAGSFTGPSGSRDSSIFGR